MQITTEGRITWTLSAVRVGHQYRVRLHVRESTTVDQYSAVQEFDLMVLVDPANRPPVIVSEPTYVHRLPADPLPSDGDVTPVDGLHFAVAPNQTITRQVSVTLPPGSPEIDVDVFFLVDTTGSMGSLIDSVKTGFANIANELISDLPNADLHFAAAEFKDFEDGGSFSNGLEIDQSLTSNLSAVQGAINGWSASGGGDTPEQNLAAMEKLANNWSLYGGRQGAQQIVIYAADILGWEDGAKGYPYPSLDVVIGSLVAADVAVYALSNYGVGERLDADGYLDWYLQIPEDGRKQGSAIAAGTGGEIFYNVNFGDVASVSDTITGSITSAVNDITVDVIASDLSVQFTNTTGVVGVIHPGDTATFDVTFTGDGQAHSFDLQFVRAGTGVQLGKLPVTVNADWSYDVDAIDPGEDDVTYQPIGDSHGASIAPGSGVIAWQPIESNRSYAFTVQARNSRGGTPLRRGRSSSTTRAMGMRAP
ncbi:MAG TPA: vWA domain-containing protein [Tepidisphaeraceae bacterium]|jgi:hypothetical protein|nr:vWA domain-containing protein [Tepidisphaeraceae bacterium]